MASLKARVGITADGIRTAVRDYREETVVEELSANSYDADASTVLVLLETGRDRLHIIDDGLGFSRQAIQEIAVLGGGDKKEEQFSRGKRHYLGSYGFGLKSTLNIAKQFTLRSISADGLFEGSVDWTRLQEALAPAFPGFEFAEKAKPRGAATGTHITLELKNPTDVGHLDRFRAVLSNLPEDGGNFRCYCGHYGAVKRGLGAGFANLSLLAKRLSRKGLLTPADTSALSELSECEVTDATDEQDRTVSAKYFFAGIRGGKVASLKIGLRGIYVRIHGRLLKQSFTDRAYTYNITKWVKFENGLRVELKVDWLRDQVTLSREGVRFSNPKLQEDFRGVVGRLVGRFIKRHLAKLQATSARASARKSAQRLELAKKRSTQSDGVVIESAPAGFRFVPESDAELALLIAQPDLMRRVNKAWRLIDYNDQAPFDCMLYDSVRDAFIAAELEPTLIEFAGHRDQDCVELVVTWTLGKWRTGATKKGKSGHLKLVADDAAGRGHYKLQVLSRPGSKNPKRIIPVIVLDEILARERAKARRRKTRRL